MHDAVSVDMQAPPSAVWALVSDVTRTGEFSPETLECQWVGDTTGPAAGARFRGHVKRNGRGPMYWTECVVDVCEPEREFTFTVMTGSRRVNTWSYRLEPVDGGTRVTESFSLAPSLPLKVYWALAGRWRGGTNRRNMRTTLERMRAVVEAGDAGADGV